MTSDQNPRTGAFNMADEAYKWGIWRDRFAETRQNAALLSAHDQASRCLPYFRTLLEEFLYVWEKDQEFIQRYEPWGSPEDLFPADKPQPTVADMGMILAWLKSCISRNRYLWGYPKTGDGTLLTDEELQQLIPSP